jgi:hypothetical protein
MNNTVKQAKAARVWVSTFGNTSIYIRTIMMMHERAGEDDTREELEKGALICDQYTAGFGVPEAEMPLRFCGMFRDTRIRKLSDYFMASGFIIVSPRCAEVFSRFDLGTGGFYPVDIYHGDRKTRVAGDYFLLNFGCRKRTFLPADLDPSIFRSIKPSNGPRWLYAAWAEDDACTVSTAALQGPDIWVEEQLHDAFFLSDRLVRALRDAKLTRSIRLRRCRVLDI